MTVTNNQTHDISDDRDASADLEIIRSLITQAERQELVDLRDRVAALEALVLEATARTTFVGDVLVDAVETTESTSAELGNALMPALENAVSISARTDSTVLAEALYPVLGPAMRKMIANLFTFDGGGRTFQVDQVLLIERGSGVLLAAASSDGDELSDADIVSGMLDAIRMFVQDAFETPDHDGLQDLRVGDTSVVVEWGPKAVLASVIHGIPTEQFRLDMATTLERIHADFATEFESFNGNVEPFGALAPDLSDLHKSSTSPTAKSRSIAAFAVAGVLVGLVILALVALL